MDHDSSCLVVEVEGLTSSEVLSVTGASESRSSGVVEEGSESASREEGEEGAGFVGSG